MVLHSDAVLDVATVSNFRDVVITNYHLDLDVNFDKKIIQGIAVLSLKVLTNDNLIKVKLDTHETLEVHEASDHKSGKKHVIDVKPFTGYGSALLIELSEPKSKGEEFELTIKYTAKGGPGVIWLDPAQTAGKKLPFMYTQGQAVMNRSFFPCQDTPAVKSQFTAIVKIPDGFKAIMSANESSFGKVANLQGDTNVYYFKQSTPIQSYLVALAVGDLQSAEIGPRSCVWAEPSILAKAKAEFDGVVEDFIQAGEKLFGPYVWGRYDLLIMPPSFPFGGMENPCLTFVTPCILVGDKSLTDVVIHEISHSWFGNLVTNANWSEFWLNEGFTMFAQRRIMEELLGKSYTCLETATGLALLRQHMDNTGEDHPLNRLRVIIEPGVDPDDTYNETPYEKGFAFVCYLQHLVGDVKIFDDFLKAYVNKYKFQSVVAEDMFDFFFEYFPELKKQAVDKREGYEFDHWLNTPGWPPFIPDLSAGKKLTDPAEQLASQWAGDKKPDNVDISTWKSYQVLHFQDKLLEKPQLPSGNLAKMAERYPLLAKSHNAEIRLRWAQVCIKNNHQEAFPEIRDFLHSQGKQKYTLPIYKALMKSSKEAKQFATDVFNETKDTLHSTVQKYVSEILSQK